MIKAYGVAWSKKEAQDNADAGFFDITKADAKERLKAIRKEADPFYANRYHIYRVVGKEATVAERVTEETLRRLETELPTANRYKSVPILAKEIRRQQAEIAALVERVEHYSDCQRHLRDENPCTCGIFAEISAEVAKRDKRLRAEGAAQALLTDRKEKDATIAALRALVAKYEGLSEMQLTALAALMKERDEALAYSTALEGKITAHVTRGDRDAARAGGGE